MIAGITGFYLVPEPLPELTRAEFLAEVRAGHVRRVEVNDLEIMLVDIEARGAFRTGERRRPPQRGADGAAVQPGHN